MKNVLNKTLALSVLAFVLTACGGGDGGGAAQPGGPNYGVSNDGAYQNAVTQLQAQFGDMNVGSRAVFTVRGTIVELGVGVRNWNEIYDFARRIGETGGCNYQQQSGYYGNNNGYNNGYGYQQPQTNGLSSMDPNCVYNHIASQNAGGIYAASQLQQGAWYSIRDLVTILLQQGQRSY